MGCQRQNDLPPAAIEFHEFPIHHPNIQDDEDWLFESAPDTSGQKSPLGAGGSSSQLSNCLETITVDFEPVPFGNLVQTVPYHIQKEPMQDAFISVKVATHQLPWIIWFYSENVLFAEQATISFDDYGGSLDCYISIDQKICEVHLWDTIKAADYLYNYEQLVAEMEIECYTP